MARSQGAPVELPTSPGLSIDVSERRRQWGDFIFGLEVFKGWSRAHTPAVPSLLDPEKLFF